jgi:hypothetical protein
VLVVRDLAGAIRSLLRLERSAALPQFGYHTPEIFLSSARARARETKKIKPGKDLLDVQRGCFAVFYGVRRG